MTKELLRTAVAHYIYGGCAEDVELSMSKQLLQTTAEHQMVDVQTMRYYP